MRRMQLGGWVRTSENRLNRCFPNAFDDAVISCSIIQKSAEICRLLVKILVRYPKGLKYTDHPLCFASLKIKSQLSLSVY